MHIEQILLPALMAAAAGLIGCFALMRRMTLAGDALSHVALPGIGIALLLHVHPLLGAAGMLALGALLVWAVEDRSQVATETAVGVIFSAALAVGSLITPGDELLQLLLGEPRAMGTAELAAGLTAAATVIVFIITERRRLLVAVVSRDMARTAGINVRRLDFVYLQLFAITVALGLRYLGVLLVGSLIIIPAATARRLSSNLTSMLALAAGLGAGTTIGGVLLAASLQRPSGPIIVVIAAALFTITLARRPA
jgi:ABC-type Mn2+/Zn2+ transport system permease subunit